jgi:hypothetical protein
MTIARLIAALIGFAIVYTLQYVVGWPWYAAIPVAIVGYLAARYIGESITKTPGPVA